MRCGAGKRGGERRKGKRENGEAKIKIKPTCPARPQGPKAHSISRFRSCLTSLVLRLLPFISLSHSPFSPEASFLPSTYQTPDMPIGIHTLLSILYVLPCPSGQLSLSHPAMHSFPRQLTCSLLSPTLTLAHRHTSTYVLTHHQHAPFHRHTPSPPVSHPPHPPDTGTTSDPEVSRHHTLAWCTPIPDRGSRCFHLGMSCRCIALCRAGVRSHDSSAARGALRARRGG